MVRFFGVLMYLYSAVVFSQTVACSAWFLSEFDSYKTLEANRHKFKPALWVGEIATYDANKAAFSYAEAYGNRTVVISAYNPMRYVNEFSVVYSVNRDSAKDVKNKIVADLEFKLGKKFIPVATFSEYEFPARGAPMTRWEMDLEQDSYLFMDEDVSGSERSPAYIIIRFGCDFKRLKSKPGLPDVLAQ